MATPQARLKEARIRAGFTSATQAAKRLGITTTTYITHESGEREIRQAAAHRYAEVFNTTPQWLLFGIGDPVPTAPSAEQKERETLIETWRQLTPKQRKLLLQFALMLLQY